MHIFNFAVASLATTVKGLFQPSFEAQPPEHIRAIVGETVNLDCQVDGQSKQNPNFVQWVKGGMALGFPPLTKDRYEQRIGPSDYSLKIENVQLSDEDSFECQITPFGLRSQVGILEIITPPKTVDITPVGKNVKITKDGNREILQVVEGVPTRLRCIATDSKPKTDISWTINSDLELTSSTSISGDLLFTTVSELILIPERNHHNQPITCFANNTALEQPIKQQAFLDVQTTPDVKIQLEKEYYQEGETLKAKCIANGNPSVDSYEWFIDNKPLESTADTIEYENISYLMNDGILKCKASNTIGSNTDQIRLNVQYYPKLMSLEPEIIANNSEPFELICHADGNPKPSISWLDDVGGVVSSGSVLTFESISYSHFGVYSCRAENELGTEISNVNLSVRGSPFILSNTDQSSPALSCDFVAEPKADLVQIFDLTNDQILFENDQIESGRQLIEVKLEKGNYECRVTNALGVTSMSIQLQPQGLSAGIRIGIICAILLVFLVIILVAMIKLRFFAREHRFKLKSSETDDDFAPQDNRMNHDISYPFPISAPIPTNFTGEPNPNHRMSLLRSSEDETTSDSDHPHNHHHHHHQMNEKVLMMVPGGNSENGSTGRSAHDDGYGTESGSNQKVHTVSSDSSNSDYEVNVPSLISARLNDKENKICVIWDDDTKLEPAKYRLHNMSRARSVSHV